MDSRELDARFRRVLLLHILDGDRGGAGGIAARSLIYMGAPIGVVEIHLRAKLPPM